MQGQHRQIVHAQTVIVSPEMTTIIGAGSVNPDQLPSDAALLAFVLGETGSLATLRVTADAPAAKLEDVGDEARQLSCYVKHDALLRLFGWAAGAADGARFHLTSELRAIVLALVNCPLPEPALATYRIGKSIELLCETMRLIKENGLVPLASDGALTELDSRRLAAARRIIDERWSEKLTLDGIARACGINRAKLTRGFREIYHCSVAEALAERRLIEARRRLLTTDLPVSSIGYASGYLNNASFSRAFGRRFGVSPTECRLSVTAA